MKIQPVLPIIYNPGQIVWNLLPKTPIFKEFLNLGF